MADNRPRTIDECAQIAYDAIMRRTGGDVDLADIMRRAVRDAYRVGANRALEDAAQTVESVAPDAARHIRDQKQPQNPTTPALTPVERLTQRPTAGLLQAAVDVLRARADAAPAGPYTGDLIRAGTRALYANDGDLIAVVADWAGGHGQDTGTPEQTVAHLALWHPEVARAVADHLETVANNMAWLAPYRKHEPGYPVWYSAVELANTILGEDTR